MSDSRLDPPPLMDRLRQRMPAVRMTQGLVAANVLVFVAMLMAGAGLWHSPNGVQLAWGASFGPATKDGQWWRLGTAMFLHFGLLHLAMNMWALWDAGSFVERMYGRLRFIAIYFISGLSGNLLSLIAQGDRAVSGGASGAVFGVFGALLVFLWRERRGLHPREFRWLFWGAAGFSAVTIVLGLLVTGIDNAAHVGGFCAGALAGIALARPLTGDVDLSGRTRAVAAFTLAVLIVIVVARIPAPSYRWHDEELARREIGDFLRDEANISGAWQQILEEGQREGISFEALAGRIDAAVTERYEESFEQLSRLPANPAMPSSATVDALRRYAEQRRDASRALAEGLRAHDPQQIRDALDKARIAQQQARSAKPRGP